MPSERSLLAFDEPELHLHPALLTRVVSMFERISKKCPVIVTTHSDRFLDVLAASLSSSVVLCQLDDQRATQLLRPDPDMLQKWGSATFVGSAICAVRASRQRSWRFARRTVPASQGIEEVTAITVLYEDQRAKEAFGPHEVAVGMVADATGQPWHQLGSEPLPLP
jgi:hypothetical protein